jgi:hypothetical protein
MDTFHIDLCCITEEFSALKGGLTPRQQLATCCLQYFLVMTGNITKKCCRQHVANCCLGVRPPLGKKTPIPMYIYFILIIFL